MRRTTSMPALTKSSLPTLNAPATGASWSTSLSATSGFGTSNATISGLCMTPALRHGRHSDGTIFKHGRSVVSGEWPDHARLEHGCGRVFTGDIGSTYRVEAATTLSD